MQQVSVRREMPPLPESARLDPSIAVVSPFLTLYIQHCQSQVDRCDYCGRLAKRVRGVALCSTCA